MTFLLPPTEVLGLASEEISSSRSLHDAFFAEESGPSSDYSDFGDFGDLHLSPSQEYESFDFASGSYEIVSNENKVSRDPLRLRLRMSDSVSLGPGSVGSSPNEMFSDSEMTSADYFLNLPTDYVTAEESKQAACIAPSPAYSTSSGSTNPSPRHQSFSPRRQSLPPKRRLSSSSSSSSPLRRNQKRTVSQICKVTPIERKKVIDITASPEKPPPPPLVVEKVETSPEPPKIQERSKGFTKKFQEKKEELLKDREREIIEVEKKDAAARKKEGAVIGSMERGPRMFGVRYGPCDRPKIEDATLTRQLSDVKKLARVKHSNAALAQVNLLGEEARETSNQMVLNQQLKLNANSNSPKLPAKSNFVKPNMKMGLPETLQRAAGHKQWSCPIPKAKIELPPYKPQKVNREVKCRRRDTKNLLDMFFQQHVYCSIEKPLFATDPEVLKASETYQLMLNTFMTLEAQRARALKDLDQLESAKSSAQSRPYKFIKQLKKGELVFPHRQRIAKVPEVNINFRGKEMSVSAFKAPSGQIMPDARNYLNATRLKEEPY